MKLTILLPLIISLTALPNISAAQNKSDSFKDGQYKNGQYKEVKSKDSQHQTSKNKGGQKKEVQNKGSQNKGSKNKAPQSSVSKHKGVIHKEVKHKAVKKVQYTHKTTRAPVHHQRVVYKTGAVVHKVPSSGISLRFGNVSFIFNEGVYYRPVSQGYAVVRPPVGLKVRSLPKGREKVVIKGRGYYVSQGIYYVHDNGYYRVINEPRNDLIYSSHTSAVAEKKGRGARSAGFQLGSTYGSIPQGAKSVTVNGQQYFKYRDVYFLPQSSGRGVHYLAVRLN